MIVVVSTHLDDAVLSCWRVLAGGEDVRIVTVFTAAPPPGELFEWDQDTDAPDSATRMGERLDEDRAALAVAGRPALLRLQPGHPAAGRARKRLRGPARVPVATNSFQNDRWRFAVLRHLLRYPSVRVCRATAESTIPGLGADEVDSDIGNTEPVALTVWILSVKSPALLPRCNHVSAELR